MSAAGVSRTVKRFQTVQRFPLQDGCTSFDIALEVGKKIECLEVAKCQASSDEDKTLASADDGMVHPIILFAARDGRPFLRGGWAPRKTGPLCGTCLKKTKNLGSDLPTVAFSCRRLLKNMRDLVCDSNSSELGWLSTTRRKTVWDHRILVGSD